VTGRPELDISGLDAGTAGGGEAKQPGQEPPEDGSGRPANG